jgi:predicted phage terminase large subunit-like protein
MTMTTLTVRRPKLYPAQREIEREARRFNVLACGRRWGKTTYGVRRLMRLACNDGMPVAYFAPTYGMVTEVWREYIRRLRPVTVRMNASQHRLELITGGVLDMWSLDSPDAARGRKYAQVVIDEAAMIPDLLETFNMVIRPTLADYSGGADFYSTPRGFNDFFTLYTRGDPKNADRSPEWAAWQQPTSSNPFIAPSEIEAMRAELTSLQYSQEVLAEFVNLEGGLFKREWFTDHACDAPGDVREWVRFWDLAVQVKSTSDYTVGAKVGLRADGSLVIADVVRGRWEWPEARKIITSTAKTDGPACRIGVEAVAFQAAGVQELQRDPALFRYVIRAAHPDKDKYTRALPWAARAEAGLVHMVRSPWNDAFLAELSDFPQGGHDDQVDAVSGAVDLLAGRKVVRAA